MARYLRAAAALFALVTAVVALAGLALSVGAASGMLGPLGPLLPVYALSYGLLGAAAVATLVRGDRVRLAARVAGVLLAGTALGYLPLAAATSADAAIGATLPAAAAVILLLTSRGADSHRQPGSRRGAARWGVVVLVAVAVGAFAWSAVGLAGMVAGDSMSGHVAFAGVRAGITLATLHLALAVGAARYPSVALIVAAVVDVAFAAFAGAARPVSEFTPVLAAGVVLLVLGFVVARRRDGDEQVS